MSCQCYKITSHMSSQCLVKLNDMEMVEHMRQKLGDVRKPLIPTNLYALAKQKFGHGAWSRK